jgi:Gpi18-like mannosyltransferase
MNAPTLYQWLPNDLYDILYPAGMIWGAAMALFYVTLGYKSRAPLTDEQLIAWATLSVLIVPYVLPKMHDRFFFPADVFSVLLAFYVPRLFPVPLVVCAVSFFSYFPFLFGYEVIPLRYLAIVLLVPIVLLARHLFRAETA